MIAKEMLVGPDSNVRAEMFTKEMHLDVWFLRRSSRAW